MADQLKVLVVDDERMYRQLLQQTLETEGFQVVVAEDGKDALARIENAEFDIVLTDLAMPEVGGIEVLKQAKKKRESTVVVIITGFASLDTALAAIKDGVYDYITKPLQLDYIKLTMKNAGEKIRLMQMNEMLLQKLDQAYVKFDDLAFNRREYEEKITEIDRQLAQKQDEITEGIRRLKGFQDRILPIQYTPRFNGKVTHKSIFEQLKEALQMRKDGMINEQEFKLLKKKILAE